MSRSKYRSANKIQLPSIRTIRAVDRLLVREYGAKPFRRRGNAVDILIRTILSQQTNDRGRDAAYTNLVQKFPTWQDVLHASIGEIERAIHIAGLSRQKARWIKRALERIQTDFGELSLRRLARWSLHDAMDYLNSLDGVGPKTAACVLMFAFNKPIFPVDTHIHRIARRLRWVSQEASAERTQELLDGIIPNELKYQLHLNLIAHGRAICRPQSPLCNECVIRKYCACAQ